MAVLLIVITRITTPRKNKTAINRIQTCYRCPRGFVGFCASCSVVTARRRVVSRYSDLTLLAVLFVIITRITSPSLSSTILYGSKSRCRAPRRIIGFCASCSAVTTRRRIILCYGGLAKLVVLFVIITRITSPSLSSTILYGSKPRCSSPRGFVGFCASCSVVTVRRRIMSRYSGLTKLIVLLVVITCIASPSTLVI